MDTPAEPERIVKKRREFIEAVEIIQPPWLKPPSIKKEESIEDLSLKNEESIEELSLKNEEERAFLNVRAPPSQRRSL